MGLLRAVITLFVSVTLVNFIFKNKERLEQYPMFKQILPYFESSKCYFIITIMVLIMILW